MSGAIPVHWHVSPSADASLVAGIREGVERFLMEKLDLTPQHQDEDFLAVDEIQEEAAFHDQKVHFRRFMELLRRNKELHEPKLEPPHWDVIVTERELVYPDLREGFGDIDLWSARIANAVYSTYHAMREVDPDFRSNDMKRHKGVILGYGLLARRLHVPACTNFHCTFRLQTPDDLRALSFLRHMNDAIPLCGRHRTWKPSNITPTFF